MAVRNLEALLPQSNWNLTSTHRRRPLRWALVCALGLTGMLPFETVQAGPLVEPGSGLQLATQSYAVSLSQPEPINIELPYPGRFILQLKSQVGVAIQLEDRLSGLGPRAGRAGELDGRLDVFLDAGPARVRLMVPPGASGAAVLEVRGVEELHPVRSFLPLRSDQQEPLDDGQQLSAWLEVTEKQELLLEARGEALNDLRIWRDGLWLQPDVPLCRLEPGAGARRWCRMASILEPGTYRVTFYGGERLPQPNGAQPPTISYRAQLSSVSPNLLERREVSALGIERFELPAEAGFARVTFQNMVNAKLSLHSGPGEAKLGAGIRQVELGAAERKAGKLPLLELELDKTGQARVLSLEAPPGTPYTLQILNPIGQLVPLFGSDTYQLGVMVAGEGEAPPITALLLRRKPVPGARDQIELVQKAALRLSQQQPLVRRFNLQGQTGIFVDVTQAGNYNLKVEGCQALAKLEPVLLEPPPEYRSPEPKSTPFTVNLGVGLHSLLLETSAPAICTLRLTHVETANAEYMMPSETEVYADIGRVKLESQVAYMLVRPPLAGARVGLTMNLQQPERLKPARLLSPLPNMPVLREGQTSYMELARQQTLRVQLTVQDAGLYRLESLGLLEVSGELASALGGSLLASAGTGAGRNHRFETWLQPGSYRLSTRAQGASEGRLGLSFTRLPLRQAGALEPEQPSTLALRPREGALYTLKVKEPGRYRLSSQRMGRLARVRLEDEAGYPILSEQGGRATLDLLAGTYRLIILPEAVEQRVQTRWEAEKLPIKREGHGPFVLPLTEQVAHEWREPEPGAERLPDRWTFELPAAASVRFALTGEMHATLLRAGQSTPVGYIPPRRGALLQLEPGTYQLEVTSFRPNHRQPYTLEVYPSVLLPGLSRKVKLPVVQTLAVGVAGAYAVSTRCNDDARARLSLPDGTLLLEGDDNGPDWNPRLETFLPAGQVQLSLEALQPSVRCHLSFQKLDAEAEQRLKTQQQKPQVQAVVEPQSIILIRENAGQLSVKETDFPNGVTVALKQRLQRQSWTARTLSPSRVEGGRLSISLRAGETGMQSLPAQGEGWISVPSGIFATLIKAGKVERVLSSGGDASFHRLRWEGQTLVLHALDDGQVSWHERSSLPYAVSVSAEPNVLRLSPTEGGVLWLKPPVMLDPMRLSAQGGVQRVHVWTGEQWEPLADKARLWTENTLIRVEHGPGALQLAWTPEQLRAMQEQRITFEPGQSHGVTVASAPVGIPLPAVDALYSALAGQPGWVQLLCGETRGPLLALEPGQPTFWTVGAGGSCGSTPGTVRVVLSPQVPGSGSLVVRIERESLLPWREGEQSLGLLEPGGVRFGKLVISEETPLGVGLRARKEVSTALLLDAKGKRLAQGPVIGKTLSAGTYYLGAYLPADEKPLPVTLRVFGLEPRSTLPAPELQQQFRSATAYSEPRLSPDPSEQSTSAQLEWDMVSEVLPSQLPRGPALVRPLYPHDPALQARVLALDGVGVGESSDEEEELDAEGGETIPVMPEEPSEEPSEAGE